MSMIYAVLNLLIEAARLLSNKLILKTFKALGEIFPILHKWKVARKRANFEAKVEELTWIRDKSSGLNRELVEKIRSQELLQRALDAKLPLKAVKEVGLAVNNGVITAYHVKICQSRFDVKQGKLSVRLGWLDHISFWVTVPLLCYAICRLLFLAVMVLVAYLRSGSLMPSEFAFLAVLIAGAFVLVTWMLIRALDYLVLTGAQNSLEASRR